jgi:hypothetical protein
LKRTGGVVDQSAARALRSVSDGGGRHLFEYGGFHAADARQPPAGLSHFFDQKLLVRGCGREGAFIFRD